MCPEPPGAPVAAIGLEVTGHEQHDAWWSKGWPPVERVRRDVWSIPVPVPDNPIRYTLCYLLFGADELVVVDPGWDTEPGWTALLTGLAAAGTTAAAVTGVAITHVHPDHHGMTARLAGAAGGAWIGMHPGERASLPSYSYPRGTVRAQDAQWITEQGVPAEFAQSLSMSDKGLEIFRTMVEPDLLLADGDYLPLAGRRVRALWTPGHTPGHLCFHDEDNDVLLTGDHVLPRISPNVGLQPHAAASPLGPYLDSLRRIADLDSAEVLPAHEWRFRGLALRTEQLLAHHEDRCAEILTVMGDLGPCTSWQVTEKLTWSRGWAAVEGFQRRAALAETIAHLVYLVEQGRIGRTVSAAATTYSIG
jgi:glyoxylase-like metal-dependent hydrolase (beta-lactamase superfamily II)